VIHFFDVFPDLPFAVEGFVIEVISPMAKITGNDEHSILVLEVGGENGTEF